MASESSADFPTGRATFGADGILVSRHSPSHQVTLENARKEVAAYLELSGGRRVPCLVDIRQVTTVTREARAYFAGPETARVEKACALLVDSALSRMVANFFLRVSSQDVPTRVFSDEEQARAWLRGFLD